MIRFRNVTKSYPRTGAAVENVSFHIRKGEFAFLTGHSGAGKTTLLQLMHFQTLPTEGQVQVSRYNSGRVKRRQIPDLRRRVGYVFQDFKLLDRLTAAENVAFALEVTGTPRREIDHRVQKLLSQVGLAAKARSRPEELSGGERQRVVIARALATDPLVLLADEPTGNLDPRAAEGVFQLFRTLNRLGMAVVMATHDAVLIRDNPAIRVLELEHGRLVFDSIAAVAAAEVDRAKDAARAVSAEPGAPAGGGTDRGEARAPKPESPASAPASSGPSAEEIA
ncbi:MAG: cell division ATP-binding protein FtsE [Gemmatimonadota bacterium]|nr:cell division ATP-binding protein FtsE [Gemmatimonadota bacterium]